ncbi:MAG: hypothetical protein KDC90_17525, partial [Ignavibacteriae bacterium]|nr:hypothetical protein [Ignavibacteriota bacterium]
FERDLNDYYDDLFSFVKNIKSKKWFPKYFIYLLLPYAHINKMFMHASPKELSYMTRLRIRPGGHINYRTIAYLIAEKAAKADRYIKNLKLNDNLKPNPSSRDEFVDRS